MSTISRSCLLLVVIIALLAGCSTPTPAPAPTTVPTEPPTSTPVPPTATPVPTNTPLPPTDTPAPTATPRPTNTPVPTATPLPTNTPQPSPTKVVTPKPTNTKAAAVSTGGGVSSQPSTLANSITQVADTTQGVISLLNQMTAGGGAELCAPLIANYQSIHNAPAYDMTGHSNEAQQAYDAYRSGINLVDTVSERILSCGQGSGPIGSLEIGKILSSLRKAVTAFSLAQEAINRGADAPAVSGSSPSPLAISITQVRHGVTLIGGQMDGMYKGNAGSCDALRANYQLVVNAPTYEVGAEPPNVQGAYELYRQAISIIVDHITQYDQMCANGGGNVGRLAFDVARGKINEADNLLANAYNMVVPQ